MAGILVYALHYEGAFNKNSLGAVAEAAKLAGELGTEAHAIVVGEGIADDLAAQLGGYGAAKVFKVEAPEGLAQPVVDAVVAFDVEVFGDAVPPTPGRHPESPPTYGPLPPAASVDDGREPFGPGENCTLARDAAGSLVARLPMLGAAGTLVPLRPPQLRDGPWCAGPENGVYDADLFRIRRLDVRLRVESAAARLRGPAGLLFTRAGHGRAPSWVRDLELRFSLTPPNLEPSR